MSWIPAILTLILFAIFLYILYAMGLLIPRPYMCIIKIPRLGGGFKTVIAKARRVAGGKFEVAYSLMMRKKVNAPLDKFVGEGNIVGGISASENEIEWFETETIDGKSINYKTQISEEKELAFATVYDHGYEMTHRKNPMMELLIPAAFVLAVIIVFIGLYLYGQSQERAAEIYAGAISQNTAALHNATIYVSNTQAGGSGFPNTPTKTYTPPG